MFNIIDPTNLYQDNNNNTAFPSKRYTKQYLYELYELYTIYCNLRKKGLITNKNVEQQKKEGLTPKSIQEKYLAEKKEVEKIKSQTNNSSDKKLTINYKN